MSEETNVRDSVTRVIDNVDLFDSPYPHNLLHKNGEELIAWCEVKGNLSQEGKRLLVRFLDSFPVGPRNSTKDILDYMREECKYHG